MHLRVTTAIEEPYEELVWKESSISGQVIPREKLSGLFTCVCSQITSTQIEHESWRDQQSYVCTRMLHNLPRGLYSMGPTNDIEMYYER